MIRPHYRDQFFLHRNENYLNQTIDQYNFARNAFGFTDLPADKLNDSYSKKAKFHYRGQDYMNM